MLKDLMENKRLDFNAPILSTRRSSLLLYKSMLKLGPVRSPGVVPFVWEQTPGHPKDFTDSISNSTSRLDCSLMPSKFDGGVQSQEPIASSSELKPLSSKGGVKKLGKLQEARLVCLRSSDTYSDAINDHYKDHLTSKGCGLLPLFCLKSSLCLLNPVHVMKVPSHLPPSPARSLGSRTKTRNYVSFGNTEEEYSWEAACEHKMGLGDQSEGEDRGKLNDPETSGGGPRLGKRKCKSDGLDSCKNGSENDLEIAPHNGDWQGWGCRNTTTKKSSYLDSANAPVALYSNSTSVDATADIKGMHDNADLVSEVALKNRGIRKFLASLIGRFRAMQPEVSKVVDPDLLPYSATDCGEMCESGFRNCSINDYLQPAKGEDLGERNVRPTQSLLPPPLPKTPSESWLSRTLPLVSSKNPSAKLFCTKFSPKKQAHQEPSNDLNWKMNTKPFKVHSHRISFAEVLTMPVSP